MWRERVGAALMWCGLCYAILAACTLGRPIHLAAWLLATSIAAVGVGVALAWNPPTPPLATPTVDVEQAG